MQRRRSPQDYFQESGLTGGSGRGGLDVGKLLRRRAGVGAVDAVGGAMSGSRDDNQESDMDTLQRLEEEFKQLDRDVKENRKGGVRWIPPKLLKELPGEPINELLLQQGFGGRGGGGGGGRRKKRRARRDSVVGGQFSVNRKGESMAWTAEWKSIGGKSNTHGPKVDYTTHDYVYPDNVPEPPEDYPPLEPMGELLSRWPQDEIDDVPSPFVEKLMHFDFSNPEELRMAKKYRDAELPFKVYNVPELQAANTKWTDEYLSDNFDVTHYFGNHPPKASGTCQESPDSFFAFYTPIGWDVATMGPPPTRNNDYTFLTWASHARYADAIGLPFDKPHFYYQAGVPKEERLMDEHSWTFISRDLPSFSSSTETFFVFHPDEQKGIQCRFGERGVTAATHYDAGRNMVGMITGAKRYILSPPKECSKLGIITTRGNGIFRHSLLNFGHMDHLNEQDEQDGDTDNERTQSTASREERRWLERSRTAMSIETVLKAGEVLYIPSHWFHYITSLQKSAQCNVRSGVDDVGTAKFGSALDVSLCTD